MNLFSYNLCGRTFSEQISCTKARNTTTLQGVDDLRDWSPGDIEYKDFTFILAINLTKLYSKYVHGFAILILISNFSASEGFRNIRVALYLCDRDSYGQVGAFAIGNEVHICAPYSRK